MKISVDGKKRSVYRGTHGGLYYLKDKKYHRMNKQQTGGMICGDDNYNEFPISYLREEPEGTPGYNLVRSINMQKEVTDKLIPDNAMDRGRFTQWTNSKLQLEKLILELKNMRAKYPGFFDRLKNRCTNLFGSHWTASHIF